MSEQPHSLTAMCDNDRSQQLISHPIDLLPLTEDRPRGQAIAKAKAIVARGR
jgi:hypothetical protein